MKNLIGLTTVVLGLVQGAVAQEQRTVTPEAVAKFVRSYRGYFTRPDPKRLPQARLALGRMMATAEKSLMSVTDGPQMLEKLRWPDLRQEQAVNAPDIRALDEIYRGSFFDQPGMEAPEIERLREALREYRDAAEFAVAKDLERTYDGVIDEIARLIPRYEAQERAADRLALGDRIGWLDRARQATPVVTYLKQRYNRSNSVMQLHVNLVKSYATKAISQSNQGTRMILGNPTSSDSKVNGNTYLKFIPSTGSAEVEVGMVGRMTSNSSSTGGARGVTVWVNGTTVSDVHVQKRITVTGLSADKLVSHPATATVTPVSSSTNVQSSARPLMPRLPRGLQFLRNMKENIGRRRAYEQIPAGQMEGRRIAAEELAASADAQAKVQQMSPEVKNVAGQFEHLIKEMIELVQKRKGVYPRNHWMATDEQWMYLRHVRHAHDELGAFGRAPAFREPGLELGIRFHESEIANTANWQLAGQEMTDATLQWFGRNVLNYVPAPLRLGTHVARWSGRLAASHPFVLDLEDERMELELRFDSLTVQAYGETPARSWHTPFAVRAVYRLVNRNGGIVFVRLEEATVVSQDPSRKAVDEDLAAFLLPKARALFGPELRLDGLTPVRGGIFEPLTKVTIREARTEKNWMILGGTLEGELLEIIKATPSGLGGDSRVITPGTKPQP